MSFGSRCCQLTTGPTIVDTLLPMLEIYLSASDSTCGLERDLGTLLRILEAHKGPVDEDGTTISYCTELYLDGPDDETGIATIVDGLLMPTDYTRECAQLWTSLHGRRFCVYQPGRKGRAAPQKKGTFAFLRKSVGCGLQRLCEKGKPSGDEETITGFRRSVFIRPAGHANPAGAATLLQKFDGLTKRKQAASLKLAVSRKLCRVTNPYSSHDLNPNQKLRRGKGLSGVRLPAAGPPVRPGPGGHISTLSCCREPAPERPGYRVSVLALRCSGVQLLRSVKGAGLVILDSPWTLDQVPQLSEFLLAVHLAVIALGRAVAPRSRWHECRSGGPRGSITVHFKRIFDSADRLLAMSEKFRHKQPLLTSVLHEIAQLPSSKWKVVQSLDGQKGTCFDSRLDVREFLLHERRVRHQGCGLLGGAQFSCSSCGIVGMRTDCRRCSGVVVLWRCRWKVEEFWSVLGRHASHVWGFAVEEFWSVLASHSRQGQIDPLDAIISFQRNSLLLLVPSSVCFSFRVVPLPWGSGA